MVDDDSDKENEEDISIFDNHISASVCTSMWAESLSRISPLFEDHSSVLYLDFVKDVEEFASILGQSDVEMDIDAKRMADRKFSN